MSCFFMFFIRNNARAKPVYASESAYKRKDSPLKYLYVSKSGGIMPAPRERIAAAMKSCMRIDFFADAAKRKKVLAKRLNPAKRIGLYNRRNFECLSMEEIVSYGIKTA